MRRIVGLTACGLGAFLLVFGILLRVLVASQVVRFPLNEYRVLTLTGRNVSYFNSNLIREMTGVTMRDTVTIKGDVAAGNSARAVWDEFSYLYDTTNGLAYESLSQRLAFNRRTGMLVKCCGAAVGSRADPPSAGQGYVWPIGTRRETYQVLDSTLMRMVPARFAGTATIDGLGTDKFVENVSPTRYGTQTVPGSLVGQAGAGAVTLGEYYQTVTTYWVDPTTGEVVDLKVDRRISLHRPGRPARLDLFYGSLAETSGSVTKSVRLARADDRKVEVMTVYAPVAGAGLGIVVLASGLLVLYSARRRSATGRAGRIAWPS